MSTDSEETTRLQQEEVDANYVKFREKLPDLLKIDESRFALMHSGEVIACFDTARDASEAGKCLFNGKPFSIQEITSKAVDLGYFSNVEFLGAV